VPARRIGVRVDFFASGARLLRLPTERCNAMARLGRYFLEGQPLHVIQRGNDRHAIFFAPEDYPRYREWLALAAADYACAIHAYVLMTNHVHLLVTPKTAESLPRMMQSLGRRYVRYVNGSYRRTGTLWEGRYRAAPIDSDAYFLSCCRYIELNPVRARWRRTRAIIRGRATARMPRAKRTRF
jgi:putative transposase